MLKAEAQISIEMLREMFSLDEETGVITWRNRPTHHFCRDKECRRWNSRYAGKALTRSCSGSDWDYITVKRREGKLWGHRIAWALYHGAWPEHKIDHIDGDTLNNRPGNLRDVPEIANFKNQKLRSTNKTGVMGVHWRVNRSRWEARINDGPKRIIIGLYKEFDDAVAARRAAERDLGYHPNHGNR